MIVVGATLAPYTAPAGLGWLATAEQLAADGAAVGEELRFFAALETVGGDLAPFGQVCERLADLGGSWWEFEVRTDQDRVNGAGGAERLFRICIGRNAVIEQAIRTGATRLLHLDGDLTPPGDSISKLLAIGKPCTGGRVPAYEGPDHQSDGLVEGWSFPVRRHWNTAGFLLLEREVFRHVRWGWDLDAGCTDDPTYQRDAVLIGQALGRDWATYVRMDLIGLHPPLVGYDRRGLDLGLRRASVV